MPDKCPVTDFLGSIHTIHKTSLSCVQLLQGFFNTYHLKGKQTLNEYFVNILVRANIISRVDQKLLHNLEKTVKQKFSKAVYNRVKK